MSEHASGGASADNYVVVDHAHSLLWALDRSGRTVRSVGCHRWEQLSKSQVSLESIYAATSPPFRLVYVDGNSPPPLHRYLEQQAAARGFQLIRTENYLTSNEARNLGLREVRTDYVAFLDNDVFV